MLLFDGVGNILPRGLTEGPMVLTAELRRRRVPHLKGHCRGVTAFGEEETASLLEAYLLLVLKWAHGSDRTKMAVQRVSWFRGHFGFVWFRGHVVSWTDGTGTLTKPPREQSKWQFRLSTKLQKLQNSTPKCGLVSSRTSPGCPIVVTSSV